MAITPLRADSAHANPVTRRNLMTAAMLGGAALASPVAASPLSPWQMAMARFEAAQAAEQAYERDVWNPAFPADPTPEAIAAEMARLSACAWEAEEALIATPAPHLSAVVWKIEYARGLWAEFDGWPDHWWRHVLMDLSRLAASQGGC